MKYVATVALSIAVFGVAFIGGCSAEIPNPLSVNRSGQDSVGTGDPDSDEPRIRTRPISIGSDVDVEENRFLDVGETAEIRSELEMTLAEAFLMEPSPNDMDVQSDENYLILRFEVVNRGEDALELSSAGLDFLAYNQDTLSRRAANPSAYLTGEYRVPLDYKEFIRTKVRSYEMLSGTVPFVVESRDSVLVEYAPSLFPDENNSLASWKIGPVEDLPFRTLGESGDEPGQYDD